MTAVEEIGEKGDPMRGQGANKTLGAKGRPVYLDYQATTPLDPSSVWDDRMHSAHEVRLLNSIEFGRFRLVLGGIGSCRAVAEFARRLNIMAEIQTSKSKPQNRKIQLAGL